MGGKLYTTKIKKKKEEERQEVYKTLYNISQKSFFLFFKGSSKHFFLTQYNFGQSLKKNNISTVFEFLNSKTYL